jgi:hypothetical protein
MNTNEHDEIAEHARQRAARAHTPGFDVDAVEYSRDGSDGPTAGHVEWALRALGDVVPPAGRARLSNDQLVGVANVHATLALVAAVETQNAIAALQLGIPALEHDDKTSADPRTTARIDARNRLRWVARRGLGLS